MSVRRCVWHVATPAFALVVEAAEDVVCVEAVVGVWTLDDSVELCAGDELDGGGLGVEEHPVSIDMVIPISPETIGMEFFILAYHSSMLRAVPR